MTRTAAVLPPGRLDWRSLLHGLQADGVVSAEEAARVRARFGAGDSSQHALLRLLHQQLPLPLLPQLPRQTLLRKQMATQTSPALMEVRLLLQ